MYQISFYVPEKDLEIVKNAMFGVGAGKFNNYENCAWQTTGMGQFKPIGDAKPAIGYLDELEAIEEYKVEIWPQHTKNIHRQNTLFAYKIIIN